MFLKRTTLISALMCALVSTAHAEGVVTDPVVATVNGVNVHMTDVEHARNFLPPSLQVAPMRDIYPMLLSTLVDLQLAAQKAVELGYQNSTEYKRTVKVASDKALQRLLLERYIAGLVTEGMVKEAYDKIVKKAEGQSETHARHILLDSEDHANAMILELQDGKDFAALARQHSRGTLKSQGGDLGWFVSGQMTKKFEDAANALDEGEFSKTPVKTDYGWHVILVEERRSRKIPDYQKLRTALTNEVAQGLGQDLMSQLRKEANIEKKTFKDVMKALQE
ncbi:MAG: peptidylprolyl isomerase [Magnetovibrio sp.]|nr:peptidylprolyl isomerase [Magnetovibrio sp.]